MSVNLSTKRIYSWTPDVPDIRDYRFAVTVDTTTLPQQTDLRPNMPPVWEQNALGSCTANATCGQLWYLDKTNPVEPSRLFTYYNTRVLEGTVGFDSGASIRNSIKSVVKYGYAPEKLWPYDISKFKKKPPTSAYKEAVLEKIKIYSRVPQVPGQLQGALANSLPVNFGFAVYSSFESEETTRTGIVKMPAKNDVLLGGHAVLLVGYDSKLSRYIVRNSWGKDWGDKGYCYMPYEYVHNSDLCDDFWVVYAVP